MNASINDPSQRTTGLTVRLPGELADMLKNYAFVTDISANEVIKRALIEYLKVHGRRDVMRAAFERVVDQHGKALDKLKDM
ncbi:DNA-binding protein [Mycobacterium interjectum]|uniref:DNA-binding protein n=1 Tax=Mycobacterium interjectum TaxID=33895 RepID=UPI00082D2B65|nr:DNA-binding protein [Mycobacterium interjectum]MCV7088813.1 DNA-binding protein [Mycobacterium interjectum]